METARHGSPLVSVIIPCYNHGAFLPDALESVRRQDYPNLEIIVVDDGSTDNTRTVAENSPKVQYIYQTNKGLSAARNAGIRHSKGQYLLFLDADDWLLPGAIKTNANYLQQYTDLAFVSGAHEKVYVANGRILDEKTTVSASHYEHLLQGNYIGMHATVLYDRRIFDQFLFDESLPNCEDYDLYLKIARHHPVLHHTEKIAAYRLHNSNMSGNIPGMLQGVLKILDRQKPHLKTDTEKNALKKGRRNWKNYYCQALLEQLKTGTNKSKAATTIIWHRPELLFKHLVTRRKTMLKTFVKRNAPDFSLRWLHKMGLSKNHVPAVGQVAFGDFSRTTPFSKCFGYDRGGPVDRYYIENFLALESENIKGRTLEIGDNAYTMAFGKTRVTKSEILHVNDKNPQATIIGDISHAPQIADNSFDCIILTQTLHLIYDFDAAMQTCHRILKPGGTLLLTVPGITPIDQGEWKETWYWSFTDKAVQKLTTKTFPEGKAKISSFGNVFAATAFLYGMGLPEVPRHKLDHHDPHYQVIITLKAQKALS
ncbi:glycosyltransferase [Adhaeribacter sp. BT258]|uniref:Glycosyltransferase n=1 Tax=Adhaeribacter terrigena TaxID=2793070 RepID=A0ABS1BXN1_9BACT|nr:glycosyltransferase [Adhaeribacter terrigena]MBK0401907.1 glycosyltransferase [Adhaeribacter terrigena]